MLRIQNSLMWFKKLELIANLTAANHKMQLFCAFIQIIFNNRA